MLEIEMIKFGTPVEIAGFVYTMLSTKVEKYGVQEMYYDNGLIHAKIKGIKIIIFPANVAFMKPVSEIEKMPVSSDVRPQVGKKK